MITLHKYSDQYRRLLKKEGCGIFSIFCNNCRGTGTETFRRGNKETCYSCKGKGFYTFGGVVCGNCLLDGCEYCEYSGYFYTHDLESSDEEFVRLV